MAEESLSIRPAQVRDRQAIAQIIMPVIQAGETYALERDLTEEAALDYWLSGDKETFVAEGSDRVVGTYYLRSNQSGGGRHVANCGYMTHPAATGKGVARAMGEHSLQWARNKGYRAMQFNLVVCSNQRAIRLWESLGFAVVGRLPQAFHHPTLGFVDALVMYQHFSC